MSYIGSRVRGNVRRIRGMGDDPWDTGTASGAPTGTASGNPLDALAQSFKNLFGAASSAAGSAAGTLAAPTAGAKPAEPSTVSQIGSGIKSFFTAIAPKPVTAVPAAIPVARPGISGTTVALIGGAALLAVVLLKRD